MAKKRKKAARKSTKNTTRKVTKKKVVEPEFMVQVSEPKMVRKDVLEALRESIIFMQGYETVQKLQQEKEALLSRLETDINELGVLINHDLKAFLPQGKLVAHLHKKSVAVVKRPQPVTRAPKRVVEHRPVPPTTQAPPQPTIVQSGLDDLERQLEEIESKLRQV